MKVLCPQVEQPHIFPCPGGKLLFIKHFKRIVGKHHHNNNMDDKYEYADYKHYLCYG